MCKRGLDILLLTGESNSLRCADVMNSYAEILNRVSTNIAERKEAKKYYLKARSIVAGIYGEDTLLVAALDNNIGSKQSC